MPDVQLHHLLMMDAKTAVWKVDLIWVLANILYHRNNYILTN